MSKFLKANLIFSKSGFKKITPETTISAIYSQLKSAHDTLFIFQGKNFLGCANLYYSLIKRRPKAKEKVLSTLYHPPKINLETQLWEIARLMVESRVYKLPVFDQNDNFIGQVNAQKLLRWSLSQSFTNKPLADIFPTKFPIYIGIKDNISKARNLMATKKVNRLLVLDKSKKLCGIISTYDLRLTFSKPVESLHFLSKSPIKKDLGHLPIERFVNKNIISMVNNRSLSELIKLLLVEDIGSVLVLNAQNKQPYRLVSTRDILKFIWNSGSGNLGLTLNPNFQKPFSEDSKEQKLYHTNMFVKMIKNNRFLVNKLKNIKLIIGTLSLKGARNNILKVSVNAKTDRDQLVNVKAKGRKIIPVFKKIIDRLEKRLIKKKK